MPPQRKDEPAVMPATNLELLRAHVDEVRNAVTRLLDHTQVVYDDINARSSGPVIVG
jgi:hypothetical protein